MKNSEILSNILKTMEENHVNLYHSISKQEIENYISTLKNLDNLDVISFDYELLKIFNKFKDAHTFYYIPCNYLDKQLFYIENEVFLKHQGEYKRVISVGNMPINCFIKNIEEMQNYETEEYLFDCIRRAINNQYYYEMLHLCKTNGSIECTIENDGKKENVILNKIRLEEYKRLGFSKDIPYYSYEIINDKIMYIKYRKCSEYKEYPFLKFVEEIRKEIKDKSIIKYILDLRDNHGGKSSIIKPLEEMVKELSLDGVVLINNGVFSSGRWAVVDFKKNFNAILIGEATGGAATSYGYNKQLQVADKVFSVALKFWDFSEVFGYRGSIQPDILVPLTLKDLKNRKDSQLIVAINYLEKHSNKLLK